MKSYQYILFDWDGNLAKTLDIWLLATKAPLESRGIHVTDKTIAIQCFGRPIEGYTELGITDIDAAIVEMDQLAKKLMPEVELYPDALFVLEALKKKGKQIALITTSLRNNVIHLLDKYNLHDFFDVVITHEDTLNHKPHPEPLEKALEELGGDKESAIMIGDSDKDIGAANNAGVDSILFYPDVHEKFYDLSELQALQPTYTISDFRQVIDIVSGVS
jgi:pyrophosphatase PpaX